jgi:hypothetical protein
MYVPGENQTAEAPLDSGKPFKHVPRKYRMDTARRSILLAAVPLLIGSVPLKAAIEEVPMAQSDQDFGRLKTKAPAELSRFGFLIGKWQCEANLVSTNGTGHTFRRHDKVATSLMALRSLISIECSGLPAI